MVDAYPSMPDTLDGYGILAQAEMRGVRTLCTYTQHAVLPHSKVTLARTAAKFVWNPEIFLAHKPA